MTTSADPLDILLVTSNYPFEGHPNVGTFVASLANAWARQHDRVQVIAPLPIWSAQTRELVLRHPTWQGPSQPTVIRPSFMSYSNKRIGPFSTQAWTTRSFERAVARAARRLAATPDLVYSHFLFPAGAAGAALARRLGCPAVVALGESGFEQAEALLGSDAIRDTLRAFDGILSVSEENAEIVSQRYGADRSKIAVIPNAADTERFQPFDRQACRRELGLPEDATILAFTGYFIERKGPLRVFEAMTRVDGLHGVFLGDGPQRPPESPRVLHTGHVPHDQVAKWLSAADFFVLPTQAEGSPNAVIEAMACGLPIVSSSIPSVRETVDDDCALLVDPDDVDAITEALEQLARDAGLRRRMSEAALVRGRATSLDARATRIREWLRQLARAS